MISFSLDDPDEYRAIVDFRPVLGALMALEGVGDVVVSRGAVSVCSPGDPRSVDVPADFSGFIDVWVSHSLQPAVDALVAHYRLEGMTVD